MMQKPVMVLKSNFTLAQGAEGGPQMLMTMGGSQGGGGPKPDTSMRNYWNTMRRGPKLMDRLRGAAGFFGKPLAAVGGLFAGMDALANASQSNSLTGALNAPTSALMTYQGLNPAAYMNMPPTYRGPAPSRIRTETPDIGTATPLELLQEQQTAEVEDTPDIEEHAENALIGTVGHPQEMDKIIQSAKEGHGATTPSHTPAPTETKKPTGLGGIVQAAEETPPSQSMVDSSLANQPVEGDAAVGEAVDTYTGLNQRGKMDAGSSWQNALGVLDNTSVLTPEQIEQYRQQGLPGEIQGDTGGWGTDADWDKNSPSPLTVQELEEEKRKKDLQEGAEWGDIRMGFVPAFMEVYGDLLKGMSPHDVGIFASEVFLKMGMSGGIPRLPDDIESQHGRGTATLSPQYLNAMAQGIVPPQVSTLDDRLRQAAKEAELNRLAEEAGKKIEKPEK